MMNKFLKSILLTISISFLSLIFISSAPAAESFRSIQQQIISKNREQQHSSIQKYENTIKAGNIAEQKLAEKTKQKQSSPSTTKSSQSTKTNTKKTCDCYDQNNFYNYKSNFRYNAQGERTARIDPPCKCKQKVATPVTPIAPVHTIKSNKNTSRFNIFGSPENGKQKKQKDKPKWNINY